jgi:hypothetical protein
MITEALIKLGYTTGWVVTGDTYEGITWIDQPEKIPTKKELEDMVKNLPNIAKAEAEARVALLARLGITESEVKLLLG